MAKSMPKDTIPKQPGDPKQPGGPKRPGGAKQPGGPKQAGGVVGNRRDRLASFAADRKREQRRRNIGMLVICLVLAGALLAYPLYLFVVDYRARTATIGDLGVSLDKAGCSPVEKNAATGNQQHVADGTKVTYSQHPPDSGAHYGTPAPFTKHFYTMEDRPAVETLVHNLEHGYTIAWYRDTLPADQKKTLEAISKTFAAGAATPQDKFIAAPWSDADGAGFPDGKNVEMVHWYADPKNPADTTKQQGIRQACSAVSGPAVKDFITKFPVSDSPEPNGG